MWKKIFKGPHVHNEIQIKNIGLEMIVEGKTIPKPK